MHALVLVTSLICAAPNVESGSLLFLQNADKIVDHQTGSQIDHVAMIVQADGQTWVYEATPPKVRRLKLQTYCQEIASLNQNKKEQDKMRLWLLRPAKPFSSREIAAMRRYVDSQLGRRYSIRGYVRDKDGDGVHCAELTASMLTRTGKMEFAKCHAENPSSLMKKVQPLYAPKKEVMIDALAKQDSLARSLVEILGQLVPMVRLVMLRNVDVLPMNY